MANPILSATFLIGALALPLLAQDPKPSERPPEKPPEKPVDTPALAPLKVGATVPDSVSMTDLDGKSITFKELRGKVVIIHFWSDRCPAEVHADPITKRLEKTYEGKDVVLLGINANQNELGAAPEKDADYSKHYGNLRKKIKEVGFTHRIMADHGNKLSALFQAKTTPHCFVIDAKGVLSYAGALDDDPGEKKGDQAVIYVKEAADALLAGKEVAVKETRSYG